MKSSIAKPNELQYKWYIVDAKDKILGRLSCEIAKILLGKNKAIFTPGANCGDFVIVINAEKVAVTGNKRENKLYRRHTGYPGGLVEETFKVKLVKHPEDIIKIAVKGMLPHNRLARTLLTKLKVYVGEKHPHLAQQPEIINI